MFNKDTEDTDAPLLMILIEKVFKETHFSLFFCKWQEQVWK